jgi:transposase
MSERRRKWERHSSEFRSRAVERMQRGENVHALVKELGVSRSLLYLWKQRAEGRLRPKKSEGPEEPRERRIAELEKQVGELQAAIGRKALELDFFAGALRRIEETRRKRSAAGERASTPKSEGGCSRKAD